MTKILLDFDGVVFCNKQIHQYVEHRSVEFVKHKWNLSYTEAKKMNKKSYKTYGHTCLGFENDNGELLQEYNKFVFNTNIPFDAVNQNDQKRMKRIIDIKNDRNLDIYVCTNATLDYCTNIMNQMRLPFDYLFSTQYIFTSDTLNEIKPTQIFFDKVNENVNNIAFFDDSMMNINIAARNDWDCHYITHENQIFDKLKYFKD